MSLNFFRGDCQYSSITSDSFGLCDPQNGAKAFPDVTNPDEWIAEVKNPKLLPIVFTAIDKCVLQDDEYPGRGRCDGMLTTDDHLYLVELKEVEGSWQQHAKDQLLSTIDLILENHNISGFKYKKAFASNKKKGKFVYIDNEENLKLFRTTGFRLDVQAEIIVV